MSKGSQLNRQGLYRSSVHMQTIDKLAQDFLHRAADSIFQELSDAHAAEPAQDNASRTAQLTELLSVALDDAASRIWAARDSRLIPLAKDMPAVPVTPLSQVLPNLKAKFIAKLTVRAAAIANTRQLGVSNSINVSGPVGTIQTGSNAFASVTQTIATPTDDDVARALSEIAEALRRIEGERSHQALELIDDLQAQLNRDRPNPLKVSSALGGLATMIQTIPAVAPAWETILRWSTSLATLAAGFPR